MKKTLTLLILTLALVLGAGLPAHAYRDLETGEFITKDPAGFVDGPNLYAYVKQNPWTHFDPEGLYEDLGGGIHVTTQDGHTTILTGGNRELGSNAMQNHLERAVAEVMINNGDAKSVQKLDKSVSQTTAQALPLAVAAVRNPDAVDKFMGVVGMTTSDLIDRGGSFNSQSRSPGGASAKDTEQQSKATADALTPQGRGRESEARVLNDIGNSKNTEKFSTSYGKTIPDFVNETQVGDIKDVKNLTNTSQMRAQREVAQQQGKEHVVYTGEATKVSKPMEGSGSRIERRTDLGPQQKPTN